MTPTKTSKAGALNQHKALAMGKKTAQGQGGKAAPRPSK